MTIRKLPPNLINQIAAGEVVERPAAVVKELIENSIDAQATKIHVTVRNGGQSLIQVCDNGGGIEKEDLPLALERYATSKLLDDNLFAIRSFGFRGEALAAISAVSRFMIMSRVDRKGETWQINVEGGTSSEAMPAYLASAGTTIQVKDLFYATPARLKFLRSPSTEFQHIQDIVKRIALAHPLIEFVLKDDNKTILSLPPSTLSDNQEQFCERAEQILGQDFRDNSCFVNDNHQDGVQTWGMIGIPTYHRANGNHQYLYINNRPVKDKILSSVLRIAYQDYLSRDRFPVAVLFVVVPEDEVDVNVHPAKTEVRFRDPNALRGALFKTIKNGLLSSGQRTSTTIHEAAVNRFMNSPNNRPQNLASQAYMYFQKPMTSTSFIQTQSLENLSTGTAQTLQASLASRTEQIRVGEDKELNFGRPLAQVFDTYVFAEWDPYVFIIDQHAAHERLVYEQLKIQIENNRGVSRQLLLIPQILTLSEAEIDKLLSAQDALEKYGLIFHKQNRSLVVTEVPALLKNLDVQGLMRDLLDEIDEHQTPLALKEKVEEFCGTFACHGSIRAGKRMSMAEMEALLRQMEQTPYSGQCNHGRPTYIRLHKHDIEKLFERR